MALAATRLGPFRSIGKDRLAATHAALDRVGLADMASRPIQALSAGQFQRVLFARTIVQDASLILLDEPFTAVDAATTACCCRSSRTGTPRAAPSSPSCTTWTWSAAISQHPAARQTAGSGTALPDPTLQAA